MSTDPIKLVQNILHPKTSTAAASSKATTTPAATTTAPASTPAATATTSASDAFKLSQSLVKLMNQNNTNSTNTTDLSTYTAQGLKDYFQSAHEAQTKTKATAAAAPKPLDDVLKASQDKGTNSPTLSAAAQEIVKEKKVTATDTALAAVDSKLAQTVGISRTIGTA